MAGNSRIWLWAQYSQLPTFFIGCGCISATNSGRRSYSAACRAASTGSIPAKGGWNCKLGPSRQSTCCGEGTELRAAAHLKQLVDDHGERVHVHAAVVWLVAEHLGRHVAVGACTRPGGASTPKRATRQRHDAARCSDRCNDANRLSGTTCMYLFRP